MFRFNRVFTNLRRIRSVNMFPNNEKSTEIYIAQKRSSSRIKFENSSPILSSLKSVMIGLGSPLSFDNAKRLTKDETILEFMKSYENAPPEERHEGLIYLCKNYSISREEILSDCKLFIESYGQNRENPVIPKVCQRMRHSLRPQYVELFSLIARLENGVKFLIDMRYDAIATSTKLSSNEGDLIREFQDHLRNVLSLWFSVGLLSLNRITWNSSASLLEKIGRYEGVHQVRNWIDLKHRLGPLRRCYAFHHSAMPGEPLILLHVALTDHISNNITNIIKYDKTSNDDTENLNTISTAIFYSITSTQKGLQGIELGLYLIQAVVKKLQIDVPNISQFSSLSPIPGFRSWLIAELNNEESDLIQSVLKWPETCHLASVLNITNTDIIKTTKALINDGLWIKNKDLSLAVKPILMQLCAHYLYFSKRRGYALNPVCNFHLRNGATLWRLNWMADTTANGLKQSCGLMVNYRYYLDRINNNSKEYILNKKINLSDDIKNLLYRNNSKL